MIKIPAGPFLMGSLEAPEDFKEKSEEEKIEIWKDQIKEGNGFTIPWLGLMSFHSTQLNCRIILLAAIRSPMLSIRFLLMKPGEKRLITGSEK